MEPCIATVNGQAFYYFASLLKRAGMRLEASLPWETEDESRLYLTTREEAPLMNGRMTLLYEDIIREEPLDLLMLLNYGRRIRKIEVGIDPGSHTGIAILMNGRTVWTTISMDPGQVLPMISSMISALDAPIHVKIGDGRPDITASLAERLLPMLRSKDIVQVVNERSTTPRGRVRYQKDVLAAALIAMRNGAESV